MFEVTAATAVVTARRISLRLLMARYVANLAPWSGVYGGYSGSGFRSGSGPGPRNLGFETWSSLRFSLCYWAPVASCYWAPAVSYWLLLSPTGSCCLLLGSCCLLLAPVVCYWAPVVSYWLLLSATGLLLSPTGLLLSFTGLLLSPTGSCCLLLGSCCLLLAPAVSYWAPVVSYWLLLSCRR